MIFGKENECLEFKKTRGELRDAMDDVVSILNKSGKETYLRNCCRRRRYAKWYTLE